MVKRYVSEPGREELVDAMRRNPNWTASRLTHVESLRVVLLFAPAQEVAFERDWRNVDVIELDATIGSHAAKLAAEFELRTLDAIHLASMLAIDPRALTVATWDRRLHAAAVASGLPVLPSSL